ncbi:MAG: DUF4372 domain-containing protein [Tannerella sp.]|jgi:hypothetical protein|nr:DUF4372 domain-containing protein [Tannerella sp.]
MHTGKYVFAQVVEFFNKYGFDKCKCVKRYNGNFHVRELDCLYQNRWQIEVFFKWIKQNLTVKKLWGYSPNAVRVHLRVMICTHLIVAYIKHCLNSQLSIFQMMQILKVSAFDKTLLRELLTMSNEIQINQYVKEQLSLFG